LSLVADQVALQRKVARLCDNYSYWLGSRGIVEAALASLPLTHAMGLAVLQMPVILVVVQMVVEPLVIVLESDHAKVLGQTLNVMDSKVSVVCIDQIKVEHGDYLDIGNVLQTSVVPVVIKTLTFHNS
jgi:ethanolamine utilization protein EutA (predicted chaperonin)